MRLALSASRIEAIRILGLEKDAFLCDNDCGKGMTIRQLAETNCETLGYSGSLDFDHGEREGMPRKLLDASRIKPLGYAPRIPLQLSLSFTYRDFLKQPDASP